MTEQEWLTSDRPGQMLEHMRRQMLEHMRRMGHHVGDRKLRLLACAWARRVWPRLPASTRIVVDGVEQWADGDTPEWLEVPGGRRHGCQVARWLIHRPVHEGVIGVMMETRDPERRQDASQPEQAALFREIIGNPFRPVALPKCKRCDGDGEAHGSDRPFAWTGPGSYPGLCPVCQGRKSDAAWLTPQVLTLAQAAYDERPGRQCCCATQQPWRGSMGARQHCRTCHGAGRISDGLLDSFRLAILADALEEAGCIERGLLRHLRGLCPLADDAGRHPDMVDPTACPHCSGEVIMTGQVHVRGCWALDLILGKE